MGKKRGTYAVGDGYAGSSAAASPRGKALSVIVRHLDNEEYQMEVSRNITGQQLFEAFLLRIDKLPEPDYFGLYFPGTQPVQWLVADERVRKQSKGKPPVVLEFGVKFFISHPNRIAHEYTRYLMYAQLREDLASGRFTCPLPEALKLCAYSVQAELGDYSPNRHREGYLSDMMLLPKQTLDMEKEIARFHSMLTEMLPSEAIQAYLALATQQPLYGIEIHLAKRSQDDKRIFVGVGAVGIRFFDDQLRLYDTYKWQHISTVSFDGKAFIIATKASDSAPVATQTTVRCETKGEAKALWSSAVQRHTFFRRRRQPVVGGVSPLKKVLGIGQEDPLKRAKLSFNSKTESQLARKAAQDAQTGHAETSFSKASPLTRSFGSVREGSSFNFKHVGLTPERTMSDSFARPNSRRHDPLGSVGSGSQGGSIRSAHRIDDSMQSTRIEFEMDDLLAMVAETSGSPKRAAGGPPPLSSISSSEGYQAPPLSPSSPKLKHERQAFAEDDDEISAPQTQVSAAAPRSPQGERNQAEQQQKTSAASPNLPRVVVPPPPPPEEPPQSSTDKSHEPQASSDTAETSFASTGAGQGSLADLLKSKRHSLRSVSSDDTDPASYAKKGDQALEEESFIMSRNKSNQSVKSGDLASELQASLQRRRSRVESQLAVGTIPEQSTADATHDKPRNPAPVAVAAFRRKISLDGDHEAEERAARRREQYELATVSKEKEQDATAAVSVGTGTSSVSAVGFLGYSPADHFVRATRNWEAADAIAAGVMLGASQSKLLSVTAGDVFRIVNAPAQEKMWEAEKIGVVESMQSLPIVRRGFVPNPNGPLAQATSGVVVSVASSRPQSQSGQRNDDASEDRAGEHRRIGRRKTMSRIGTSVRAQHQTSQQEQKQDDAGDTGSSVLSSSSGGSLFEDVVLLEASGLLRPVLLFGPAKDAVLDTLLELYPQGYDICTPHTTRPRRADEVEGEDYFFTDVETMYNGVRNGAFVDVVAFEDHLYGTAASTVKKACRKGSKRALVDATDPACLLALFSEGLHPLALFLKPETPETLMAQSPGMNKEEATELMRVANLIHKAYAGYCQTLSSSASLAETGKLCHSTVSRMLRLPVWALKSGVAVPDFTNRIPSHLVPASATQTHRDASDMEPTKAEGVHEDGVASSIATYSTETRPEPGLWGEEKIKFAKGPQGLGFTVASQTDSETGEDQIVVIRLTPGGAAERDGRLQVGDVILEANYVSFAKLPLQDATKVLRHVQDSVGLLVKRRCLHVTLQSVNGAYGLGLRGGSDTARPIVTVSRIKDNSAADQHPDITVGNEVLFVNGKDVRTLTHSKVLDIIRGSPDQIELIIHPKRSKASRLSISGATKSGSSISVKSVEDLRHVVDPSVQKPGDGANSGPSELDVGQEPSSPPTTRVEFEVSSPLSVHERRIDVKFTSAEVHHQQAFPVEDEAPSSARQQMIDRLAESAKASEEKERAEEAARRQDEAVQQQGQREHANGQASAVTINGQSQDDTHNETGQPMARIEGGKFKKIPVFRRGFVRQSHCSAALSADNMPLNRYKDILPYDDNRVLLKEGEHEYINASHVVHDVKEINQTFRYIASQGPKVNTTNDFWQMVYEQDVRIICMLTSLVERGRPKCHMYWPETKEGPRQYGRHVLRMTGVKHMKDYAIRTFSMKTASTGEVRTIHQVQYTGWPDHGVPDGFEGVLDMVRSVQELKQQLDKQHPLLVHCSAGIGRSGVYMMLELGLAKMNSNTTIDMPRMLANLRQQRMGMVQTEDQYKFTFSALANVRRQPELFCEVTP